MTIVIAGDFNYNYSNTTSRRKLLPSLNHIDWYNLLMNPLVLLKLQNPLEIFCLLEMFLLLFLLVSVMLFWIKLLDIIVFYMQFLTLTSTNNFAKNELFGNTMKGTTIY